MAAGSTGSTRTSSILVIPGRRIAAIRRSRTCPTGSARLPDQILPLMQARVEEREIAQILGLTHGDVELLFRHLQQSPGGVLSTSGISR